MKRGKVGVAIEQVLFWWGIAAMAVPLLIRTSMLAVERVMHIGIYDPAIGGDPMLRIGNLRIGSVLFLAFSVAQLLSLLVRKGTIAGNANCRRWVFAYAGLALVCVVEGARVFPKLFPDSVILAGCGTALLLLLAAIAIRRPSPVQNQSSKLGL